MRKLQTEQESQDMDEEVGVEGEMAEKVRWAGQKYTVGEEESQQSEEEQYVQPGEWEDGKCERETECVVSNMLNGIKE
jgi:hypothetical protein